MRRIFFSLIFVLVILSSVSLVCASDVDNVTKDLQGDNVIISPELDGLNVDNYQFEDNYSTQEEIDGGPINIPDNNTTRCEYKPHIEPKFDIISNGYEFDIINNGYDDIFALLASVEDPVEMKKILDSSDYIKLTLLVTDPDTGKGLADLPIIFDYSYDQVLKLASRTDENGYVTFTVPNTCQYSHYTFFISSYGKFVFGFAPCLFHHWDCEGGAIRGGSIGNIDYP